LGRRMWRWTAGLAGGVVVTLGLWAFWLEPASLSVVEHELSLEWPGERPLRVAVLLILSHALNKRLRGRSPYPCEGKAIAAAEVVLAACVVAGHNVFRAVPNEVPILILVGLASMMMRRQPPRSIGFVRPSSWRRTIFIAAVTAVALQLASTYVTDWGPLQFSDGAGRKRGTTPLFGTRPT
jgi:hypothetical protein